MGRRSVFILCYSVMLLFVTCNEAIPWSRRQCQQIPDGFDCSDLELQVVPDEVPHSVRILIFSFNYLPVLSNFTFERLKSLNSLDLTRAKNLIFFLLDLELCNSTHRCGITFMYEDIFEHQPYLEVLILIGNPLVFIASRAFTGPLALKYISLAQSKINSLSDIPSINLAFLEILDLGGSNIHSLDGLSSFHWSRMKRLQLDMNSIESISKADLEPLHNVDGINISFKGNDISYVEPGAFESLSFESLDLSGCLRKIDISVLLRGLEGIKTERLNLGLYETDPNVYIPSVALKSFCNMSVNDLDFQLQHFSDLDDSTFHCLQGLQRLDLSRAHLSSLPSNMTGLSTLTHLVLDANNFQDICHISARSFPMLMHLSMSRNQNPLRFSRRCLVSLERLEKLDLSLSKVNPSGPCCSDQLAGLGELKVLNLSYGSPMYWNSQPFKTTPQLEHLDCSCLNYTLKDRLPFSNLQNLKTLNLSGTNTDLANVQLFKGLKSLKLLNLRGTTIQGGVLDKTELFRYVPLLETLILSACRIIAFEENLFKQLTNLKNIDLSENQLVRLSTSAFYSLKFLQLNFARNSIVTVDVGSVVNLGNGSTVDLSFNPLVCNCSNLKFINWVKGNVIKIKHLMETVCKGTGTRITDVHLQCEFPAGMIVLAIILVAVAVALGIVCINRTFKRRYARYTQL